MDFFNRYSPPPSPGLDCGPSLTHQEFARECDINWIIKKYETTGVMETGSRVPLDPDVVSMLPTDFQCAMDTLARAQVAFDGLPSSLRDRFANDPARLLAFLNDDNNREEAVKLGLVANLSEATSVATPPDPPTEAVSGTK